MGSSVSFLPFLISSTQHLSLNLFAFQYLDLAEDNLPSLSIRVLLSQVHRGFAEASRPSISTNVVHSVLHRGFAQRSRPSFSICVFHHHVHRLQLLVSLQIPATLL